VLQKGGYGVVVRSVTTDAASAHADKDSVPSVSLERWREVGGCNGDVLPLELMRGEMDTG
jgi:hypothetical protein